MSDWIVIVLLKYRKFVVFYYIKKRSSIFVTIVEKAI
jgi:hypothetical protein